MLGNPIFSGGTTSSLAGLAGGLNTELSRTTLRLSLKTEAGGREWTSQGHDLSHESWQTGLFLQI